MRWIDKPWPTVIAAGLLPAAMLFVAGCAVGPDYHPPAAPKVDGYTSTPLPKQTATAAGVAAGSAQTLVPGGEIPAQWWTLFRSPKLNTLITEALRANPDLQSAQAALREAHENYLVSRGALFPSVQLGLSGKRQKASGALFGRPSAPASLYTLYEAQAQVSYAPDVFGVTRRTIEQQKAVVDYQRYELDAAWLSLTSNVVTTAIHIAALNTRLETQRDVVHAEAQIGATLRTQVSLGGASPAALQQQLAQLAQARAQLPALKKQLGLAQNQLAALVGRLPSQHPPLQLDLAALTLPGTLPVSLPSKLVAQRPDVQAAAAQLHQASAAIGVAIAHMLPQFTITAALGSVATHPFDLFSPGGGIWSLGGALLQPVFHGGVLLHEKRAVQAAYDKAAARYRSTVLLAFRNVSDSLRSLLADADTLRAQAAAAQAAQTSYDIAKAQLAAGAIAYPALLQSQLSYQQARDALVQAQAARFADTAALFQALGGGWWHHDTTTDDGNPPKPTTKVAAD